MFSCLICLFVCCLFVFVCLVVSLCVYLYEALDRKLLDRSQPNLIQTNQLSQYRFKREWFGTLWKLFLYLAKNTPTSSFNWFFPATKTWVRNYRQSCGLYVISLLQVFWVLCVNMIILLIYSLTYAFYRQSITVIGKTVLRV